MSLEHLRKLADVMGEGVAKGNFLLEQDVEALRWAVSEIERLNRTIGPLCDQLARAWEEKSGARAWARRWKRTAKDHKFYAAESELSVLRMKDERDAALARCKVLEETADAFKFLFDESGIACEQLRERVERYEEALRDFRDNWDCDTGANGAHHQVCRCCSARAALAETP